MWITSPTCVVYRIMVWEETTVTYRYSALDIMVTRKSVFWKYSVFSVETVCWVSSRRYSVSISILLWCRENGAMSGGRSIDKERKSPRESGEDSEDESEILEESPCGRWLKRREEVSLPFIFQHGRLSNVGHQTKIIVSWFTRLADVTQIRRSWICVRYAN